MKIDIREIQEKDNHKIKQVLISVMTEFGVPDHGTALQDDEIDNMSNAYNDNNSIYYVVLADNIICGGAGISKLKGTNKNICELQKMYFLPTIRGKGVGSNLITKCLDFAKKSQYNLCYIETMYNMVDAQNLYKKNGFVYIDHPMGDTGHSSCPVWMTLEL
jgi:putative acetyltransferase